MKKMFALFALAILALTSIQCLPQRVQAEGVDVNVEWIFVGGLSSGYWNITDWLIDQPYHAPRAGVPWLKENKTDGNTAPLVKVLANITRWDLTLPNLVVSVEFWAESWVTHSHYTFLTNQIILTPFSWSLVGPAIISIPCLPMANWTLHVDVDTLGIINTNPNPNWTDDWFYRVGYCDINGDKFVNVQDFVLVKSYIPSTIGMEIWRWSADVNCDEFINIKDIVLTKARIPTAYTPI